MKKGMKVIFIGATEMQIKWGRNDNPYKAIKEGDILTIKNIEGHSWYTKLEFEEVPGMFNSVSFEKTDV